MKRTILSIVAIVLFSVAFSACTPSLDKMCEKEQQQLPMVLSDDGFTIKSVELVGSNVVYTITYTESEEYKGICEMELTNEDKVAQKQSLLRSITSMTQEGWDIVDLSKKENRCILLKVVAEPSGKTLTLTVEPSEM